MRNRFPAGTVLCTILFAIAAAPAFAQGFFLTPVPSRPFTGVVTIEKTIVNSDGSLTQLKSTREVARDSQGRIHNELRALVPASSNDAPQLVEIHLYDPQTRVSNWLDVHNHTIQSRTINHPPSTEPPSIRFADPEGVAPPSEFTKQEDLGMREIDGVQAHGQRQTQTIKDEKGKEIVVFDEYWYSQDLRVNVLIKHSDPRKETTILTLSQVNRAEPDPSLFVVPQGYTPFKPKPAAEKAN
ncbi:MAG TPA: hypothetical protein VF753_19000 [Terriglobales bacterium]